MNGFPGTLWLTQQKRVDRDYAAFGEASLDLTPQITVTAGGRLFKYDNSLVGFFGFGRNPAYIKGQDNDVPPNAAGSSLTGVAQCFTESGLRLNEAQLAGIDFPLLPPVVSGSPCTNLGGVQGRQGRPRARQGSRLHAPPERAMEAARESDVLCDLVTGLPARRNQPASRRAAL